jgi:hypothetical protein
VSERHRISPADSIRTVVVVTTLAVVVWLFAETESLGQEQLPARVTFQPAASATPEFLVTPLEGFDGEITLDVRGGRNALIDLSLALQRPIVLEPGKGVPKADGLHEIDLLDAIGRRPLLQKTGATIDYVRPPRAAVRLERLVEITAPIVFDAAGLEIEGPVAITPEVARLRLPQSLAPLVTAETPVRATLDTQARSGLTPGPTTVEVELEAPRAVAGRAGVALLDPTAALSLTVSAASNSRRFRAVPVQVLLPPIEADDYRVELDQESQFIAVELKAPRSVLDLLDREDTALVAVLSLSDIDLASGVTEKGVSFAIMGGGRLVSPPASAAFYPERETVSFTIEPREARPAP